jgi:alkylation response protein AidB-like acyl-CoA dehydrogenase
VPYDPLTDEQREIRDLVRTLARERVAPRAPEIDKSAAFPWDHVELFREHEIFGILYDEEYGGHGASALMALVAVEELSKVCATTGLILAVQELGSLGLKLAGTDEQKQRYLPRLAAGEWLCAFALSEPEAGSDVAAIRLRATSVAGGWRLDGRKVFVTQGSIADVVTVFARAVQPDGGHGITAFLVDRAESPWVVEKVEHKMGLRGSPTAALLFEDVTVKDEARLGAVGEGMRVALGSLTSARIMTAAMALGIGQGALDMALDYSQQRVQFGRPIAEFQAVQNLLADMDTELQAARALVWSAAQDYEGGVTDALRASAAAKLFATEVANRVAYKAVQVFGGYGYITEYGVEQRMRDARVFPIFEGTNEIQRLLIARELLGGQAG